MAAEQWFIMKGPNSEGPFSQQDILHGYLEGRYTRESMVWSEQSAGWKKLWETFRLDEITPPPLPGNAPAADSIPRPKMASWEKSKPYPWRRYFARQLDTLIGAVLVFAMLGVVLSIVSTDLYTGFIALVENQIVATVLGVAGSIFPNAILLGLSGRTLGKLIFGLRVLRDDNSPIGIGAALVRELRVFTQGLGLGIPIVSLFTMIGSYNRLKSDNAAPWDQEAQLTTWYRAPSVLHAFLMIAGIFVWLALVAALIGLDRAQS